MIMKFTSTLKNLNFKNIYKVYVEKYYNGAPFFKTFLQKTSGIIVVTTKTVCKRYDIPFKILSFVYNSFGNGLKITIQEQALVHLSHSVGVRRTRSR